MTFNFNRDSRLELVLISNPICHLPVVRGLSWKKGCLNEAIPLSHRSRMFRQIPNPLGRSLQYVAPSRLGSEKIGEKGSDTTRSREVTQPSTDVARDCLISRFGMELDVSSRVWPLRHIGLIVLYDIIGLVAGNLPI